MSENISLLRLRDGSLQWLRAGMSQPLDLNDSAVARDLRAQLAQRGHRVVFAAPGADIRLLELETSPEERRHLDAALPYMLEDVLAEDIEQLHFARQPLDADRIAVAVVRGAVMERWREVLAAWDGVQLWVPEPLSLPWQPGQWVLVIEGDLALLRYGAGAGAALETALLGPFLEALARTGQPEAVHIYGQAEAEDRALLPTAVGAEVHWRRGGLGEALLLHRADDEPLNLLQGVYAPRLPFERWWRRWRPVAALLLLALCAHLLAGWLDLRQLERENLVLRGEIQRIYREVNPRGAAPDPERQLRRQLAALGGGGGGSGFALLLEPLGRQLAAQEGTVLTSLSYSQRSGELRVNMLAPDFAVVEQIRTALSAAGYTAELENSSRSGDRVRARLRIAGEPS